MANNKRHWVNVGIVTIDKLIIIAATILLSDQICIGYRNLKTQYEMMQSFILTSFDVKLVFILILKKLIYCGRHDRC
jgi:hypothetical protein